MVTRLHIGCTKYQKHFSIFFCLPSFATGGEYAASEWCWFAKTGLMAWGPNSESDDTPLSRDWFASGSAEFPFSLCKRSWIILLPDSDIGRYFATAVGSCITVDLMDSLFRRWREIYWVDWILAGWLLLSTGQDRIWAVTIKFPGHVLYIDYYTTPVIWGLL